MSLENHRIIPVGVSFQLRFYGCSNPRLVKTLIGEQVWFRDLGEEVDQRTHPFRCWVGMIQNPLRSQAQKGFTLIELMLSVGIATILLTALMGTFSQCHTYGRKSNLIHVLRRINAQIEAAIQSRPGWQATVLDAVNPALVCLRPTNSGDCIVDIPKNPDPTNLSNLTLNLVRLFNPSGASVLLDRSGFPSRRTGWDLNGNPCLGAPSISCPVWIEMNVQEISCDLSDPPCYRPTVLVTGQWRIHETPTFKPLREMDAFNLDNYRLEVVRSSSLGDLGDCQTLQSNHIDFAPSNQVLRLDTPRCGSGEVALSGGGTCNDINNCNWIVVGTVPPNTPLNGRFRIYFWDTQLIGAPPLSVRLWTVCCPS